MGASGAGKTSLLNILSDRISLNNGDVLKNEIYLNDTVRVNDDNFGKVSAYVM
jgi:ABC-type multidrug transport system ATPase subunit